MTNAVNVASIGSGPLLDVAKSSGNQSITASTWTKVTFDTINTDSNSNWASNKFTPTVPGWYWVNAHAAVTDTSFQLAIYKNGNAIRLGGGGGSSWPQAYALLQANGSTDYFEMYVWTGNSGQSVFANGNLTAFGCFFVRGG